MKTGFHVLADRGDFAFVELRCPVCGSRTVIGVPATFVPVGVNPARMFGLDALTRARRLAAKARLDCATAARRGRW